MLRLGFLTDKAAIEMVKLRKTEVKGGTISRVNVAELTARLLDRSDMD